MSTSAGPEIDWETSLSKMQEFLASKEALDCPTGIVITGYIASTKEGVATTLKRSEGVIFISLPLNSACRAHSVRWDAGERQT